jgi:glycerol uptake operon antiterminator
MPKLLKNLTKVSNVPVIAGGLISDEEDIQLSLESGAIAVSTTDQDLWNYRRPLLHNNK